MNGAEDRKVAVIDFGKEEDYAAGGLWKHWVNLKKQGRLEYIGEGIEAVTWREIKGKLGI